MAIITEPISKRRGAETRDRLLQSALGVFARHGYERATVDTIVREAGFSKGAFYVHFESKDDLFWAMLEQRITRQQETFRQVLDAGVSVAENLARVLSSVLALNAADPLWSAMFMEFTAHAARNERVRERLATMYGSWRSFAIEILTAGREAGLVRNDINAEFTASLIIAIIEGTVIQSRIVPDAMRPEETVDALSRLLAEWLSPQGFEPPRR